MHISMNSAQRRKERKKEQTTTATKPRETNQKFGSFAPSPPPTPRPPPIWESCYCTV